MRGRKLRYLSLSLVAVTAIVAGAFACGEEVTVPDEVPDSSTPPDKDGGGSTPETSTDSGASDSAADVGVDVTCPVVTPDDTKSVYVSAGGIDDATCGTRAAPCKTIAFGITTAVTANKPIVNVQRGVYVEQITLAKDVEIVGGWDVVGTSWARACVSPEEAVRVRAPQNKTVTVLAENLGGEAKLTLLRIESKTAAQVTAGESIIGVSATGATTTLVLADVRVDVEGGGDGKAGAKGDAGAAAVTGCSAGSGAGGTRGAQGAGADAGTFDVSGYTPAAAAGGGAGTAGQSGTAGGAGSCVKCGSCTPAPACLFVADSPENLSCGKDGVPGCSGEPGFPGGPATGGGSSIGIYAWDAKVQVVAGRIKSGDGGGGGAGGAGGSAGANVAGVAGTNADLCVTKCSFDVAGNACVEGKERGMGGTAGGAAGISGAGGSGGGGGGGSSFAIFQGGAANVTTTSTTTLAHGKAGGGGLPDAGAGAAGKAADRGP